MNTSGRLRGIPGDEEKNADGPHRIRPTISMGFFNHITVPFGDLDHDVHGSIGDGLAT
jgi:hypothetical protein